MNKTLKVTYQDFVVIGMSINNVTLISNIHDFVTTIIYLLKHTKLLRGEGGRRQISHDSSYMDHP
jgi:hypothetical protein